MKAKNYHLHTALIASSSLHKKRSRQEFQTLNLSDGQPKILSVLYEQEGYLQKELAVRCHIEPATLTSVLNNMLQKDLVYKDIRYVSGGKRAYAIFLTDKGRIMAQHVNTIVENIEEKSFRGFSESEKTLLLQLLSRIVSNLEN